MYNAITALQDHLSEELDKIESNGELTDDLKKLRIEIYRTGKIVPLTAEEIAIRDFILEQRSKMEIIKKRYIKHVMRNIGLNCGKSMKRKAIKRLAVKIIKEFPFYITHRVAP